MQYLPVQSSGKTSLSRWLCVLSLLWGSVYASNEIAITRIGSCDWTCADEAFTQLSCHQRLDKAVEACANRALSDGAIYHIHSAQYRVTTAAPPTPQENYSIILSWSAPTHNEDGSTIADSCIADDRYCLSGYRIYHSTTPGGPYTPVANILNPTILTWVHKDIAPGAHYYVATAYNLGGVESRYTSEVQQVIP